MVALADIGFAWVDFVAMTLKCHPQSPSVSPAANHSLETLIEDYPDFPSLNDGRGHVSLDGLY